MTISTTVSGEFHRSTCPSKENNPNHQDCGNKELTLNHRCSRCVERCLKCMAPRLNTNSPYVRGCEEARRATTRTFPCVCSVQGCDV